MNQGPQEGVLQTLRVAGLLCRCTRACAFTSFLVDDGMEKCKLLHVNQYILLSLQKGCSSVTKEGGYRYKNWVLPLYERYKGVRVYEMVCFGAIARCCRQEADH